MKHARADAYRLVLHSRPSVENKHTAVCVLCGRRRDACSSRAERGRMPSGNSLLRFELT